MLLCSTLCLSPSEKYAQIIDPQTKMNKIMIWEDANGCIPNVGDHTPIVVDLPSVYGNQYNSTSRNARQPIRALILNYF